MTVNIDNPGSQSIKPKVGNPYYIVSPPYTRISAGITVLHILCHFLNLSGRVAYIVHYPPHSKDNGLLPFYAKLQDVGEIPVGMIAPLITQKVIDTYDEHKITPIVIYPEVYDNVFDASFFARFILNYPGLLAPVPTQQPDLIFAYSAMLADSVGAIDTLYVCTADLSYWNTSGAATQRLGTCYYAGKSKAFLNTDLNGIPDNSVEILQSMHMSRDEVRQLFWKSEAFYCFEDTALATEAQLCGCPVVYVPTKHFKGVPLARVELSDDGACLLGEPGGLDRARRTVKGYDTHVRATFAKVPHRIIELAEKMEALVRTRTYKGTIRLPFEPTLVYFDPLGMEGPAGLSGDVLATGPAPPRTETDRLAREVEALRSSTSWRMTAPLRRLAEGLRSFRGRTARPKIG